MTQTKTVSNQPAKTSNRAVRTTKNSASDKGAVMFTMLLYVDVTRSGSDAAICASGFVIVGEPSEKDTAGAPIQRLRFNDGIRTMHVLVYAPRKVAIKFVQAYVEAWRDGEWMKIDLRKKRTNNVAG